MTDIISNRDYTLVIDKSGSMGTEDCNGKSRWLAVQESAMAFARKCEKLDPDGMTLYVFAGTFTRYDNVTSAKVQERFDENEPAGGTNLTEVLEHAFADFKERKKAGVLKGGDTMMVITDEEPNDQPSVARAIIEVTKSMDKDEELAVTFLQIGKDQAAQKFLQYLDDGLVEKGAKFDIVDTKTFDEIEKSGMTISDVLLAAIND